MGAGTATACRRHGTHGRADGHRADPGRRNFFCGFLRDLTELEHSQAALADTEARFRLLAQLAPVGIVQNDARGRAIFVNDRWCAMTGVPAKAALGADWLDLVHPDDRGQVERDMAVTAARDGEM